MRDPQFQGEGAEYETQYRVQDDALGPVLWQRRDAVPDEYYDGGGIATPLVENINGFNVEAFDGEMWHEEWDSDDFGLPYAIRMTIVAAVSTREGERPIVLRTVVPIDRVLPPFDLLTEEEEEETEEDGAAPEGGAETPDQTGGAGAGGGGRSDRPPGGGFRQPGGGRTDRPGGGLRQPGGGGGRPSGGPGGGGGGAGGGSRGGDLP
jgi:hypothetical protein